MATSDIPTAIWEGEIPVGDIKIKVYVLDDGRRIVDEQSVHQFLEWMASGKCQPVDLSEIMAFCSGRSH